MSTSTLRWKWQERVIIDVSSQTVNRRLIVRGYKAGRIIWKRKLTPIHKQARLVWARQHLALTVAHWRHGVFADKSHFFLYRVDGNMQVRHLNGDGLNDDRVMPRVAARGGSDHVWGIFHHGGKSELVALIANVTGAIYRNVI